MEYKYVTDNNLINKQNYMYSEFGGTDFLDSYKQSRDEFISWCDRGGIEEASTKHRVTRVELHRINEELKKGNYNEIKSLLNDFVKRFEVSKRLYTEYDEKWKIADNASYEEMDIYLELAECCLNAYTLTGCAKYLSCLLKINDTLLSVKDNLTDTHKKELLKSVVGERQEYDKLCIAMRVDYK